MTRAMPLQKLFFGADHAGFALKERLLKVVRRLPLESSDLSPSFSKGDDYPATAFAVAGCVVMDPTSLGLLICGTGHGMEIAANRLRGIRAIVARTPEEATIAREHNHANVLVLGGWTTSPALATKILHAFLAANPSRATRRIRRIKQLDALAS